MPPSAAHDTGPTTASTGLGQPFLLGHTGMKRKHSARAERAEEEAVEAGHVSRRDITKLRRRQKAATSRKPDAGLTEHGEYTDGAKPLSTFCSKLKLDLNKPQNLPYAFGPEGLRGST